MDTHLIEEGLFIERGEEKWREGRGGNNMAGKMAGRPWREEMAGMVGGREKGGNGIYRLNSLSE